VVRPLTPREVAELLSLDLTARLATVDDQGFPHVTPLWFIFESGQLILSSFEDRPHLARIRANPKVGLVIDDEAPLRADGQRPNRQVRIIGTAVLSSDVQNEASLKIASRYLRVHGQPSRLPHYDRPRTLITVEPVTFLALASV
jgi:nitroimidazol reductase NimA-like FMN-containing flavoprotein (pyridoxamine 5'-phosphate oxidase superfamily)